MEAWFALSAFVVAFAVCQFVYKWRQADLAGADFLAYYTPDRITGFFSHWMTFSEVGLIVTVMLASYLLFSPAAKIGRPIWTAILALLARRPGAQLYAQRLARLLRRRRLPVFHVTRPRLLWLLPAGIVVLLFAAPAPLHRRLESIVHPPKTEARPIMWRTGLRMIEDRPLFGVGPERVGPLFKQYKPEDVTELPDAYYGHLHNMYIHYAAERGLPALAALLWLLGKVLMDWTAALRRLAPGRSERRFLLHGVVAATLGVMMTGCFDLTLGDSEILGAWLAIVVVGYRAASLDVIPHARPT